LYYQRNKEKIKARSAAWAAKNPDKTKESNAKSYNRRRSTLRDRALGILNGAKKRARSKNLPFDLDLEFVEALMAPMVCAITGLPLIFIARGKHKKAPSIDQIVAGGGYTKDNVQIVSFDVNIAKSDMSLFEFHEMCKAVCANLDQSGRAHHVGLRRIDRDDGAARHQDEMKLRKAETKAAASSKKK